MLLSHGNDPDTIRRSHQQYLRFSFRLGILLLLSEIWKQWMLTVRVWGSYQVWYVPFQLCSLPIYLCPLMAIAPPRWQDRIRTFLMTFTLLGGAAAFLDTSGMHYPAVSLTIHSYLWHILLIGIGIRSGIDYCRIGWAESCGPLESGFPLSECESAPPMSASAIREFASCLPIFGIAIREFASCLPIFGIAVLIATILNISLWPYGEISMFYISPYEAGTQPIVPQAAAILGIHTAHLLYLTAMMTGAFLLHCLWHAFRRHC